MTTPLAVHNLWHQRIRTAVSVAGVAFALLLVFMQLGFMGAVSHTATHVLEQLQFDAVLRARDYVHLYEAGQIEQRSLRIAENTPGVKHVRPLWVTIHNWRTLPTAAEHQLGSNRSQFLPIAVMAFPPEDCPFRVPAISGQSQQLYRDDVVLLDNSTHATYGPWNGRQFSALDIGRQTEIGGAAFTIAGLFPLGTGLAANGAVLVSPRGFSRLSPIDIHRTTTLGLVQFTSADSAAEVVQTLRQRLQDSASASGTAASPSVAVEVLTKAEALQRERERWLWETPIGLIFQLGVVLALLVGAAIVYLVLATDVANRLPEYATLLAMGYTRRYLAGIVMMQALLLCGMGFAAAWGAAEVLYRVTEAVSGIPLMMRPLRIVSVGALGVVMSCISGLLALRKVWKAEPASLF